MPRKTQIIIVGTAVIALLLVWQLSKYLHTAALNGPMLAQSATVAAPDSDPDHDGLSNIQESVWNTDPYDPDTDADGFKDGEEVASGHNPLVPGPDDLINDENLTDKLSELTLSGIAAGDLQDGSATYDTSLADIGDAVVDSAHYIFNKPVDSSTFTIIADSTDAGVTYAHAIEPLLVSVATTLNSQYKELIDDLNTIGDSGFSDPKMKNSFNTWAKTYNSLFTQGIKIPVPKMFLSQHSELITFLGQLRDISQAIAEGDKDPVKAAFAFDAFGITLDSYISILESYVDIKTN